MSSAVQAECCASSDGTADKLGGTGNRANQMFTFANPAGLDFHLAANDNGPKGHGADLTFEATQSLSRDIDNRYARLVEA